MLVPHVTFASAPQGVPSVREAAATAPHHHVYVSLDASMVARRFLDPLGGGESDASACSDGGRAGNLRPLAGMTREIDGTFILMIGTRKMVGHETSDVVVC